MENKNVLIIVLFAVAAFILFSIHSFKGSYRYYRYELELALINNDVSFIDKHFDFDEIFKQVAKWDPTTVPRIEEMKNKAKKDIKRDIANAKVDKISKAKLLYLCYFNKPMTKNGKINFMKIAHNTYLYSNLVQKERGPVLLKQYLRKEKGKWIVVGLDESYPDSSK